MNNKYRGQSWEEVQNELFTKEEIEASKKRIRFHLALISIREKLGLTQRELSDKAKIKQPMLARIESGKNNPKINTAIKILKPLGFSLAIINDSNEIVHVFK